MPNYYDDQPIPLDPNTMQPYQASLQQQPNFRWQAKAGSAAKDFMGNRDLALALLANSGWQQGPKRGFGSVLGQSMMQADQMKSQRQDDAFKRQYMMAQMQAMGNKAQGPQSVQEYEYARQGGYKGSYEDWTKLGGQTSRPSSVQEWEFFNNLPKEQQQRYLEMKRNPNWKVGEVNQIPTVIQGGVGGEVQTTPLSTLPQVASSAETVKQAEGRGAAIGGAQGGITGGILTKGSNAKVVTGLIGDARKILSDKDSTGSPGGTFADALAGAVGISTGGAKGTAKLKVIQSGLMLNMPRMEGPQSDRDVALYQQAAAQVGDSTVPAETRMAALDTIEEIQTRYVERAADVGGGSTAPAKSSAPAHIKSDAEYDALPSGSKYIAPDGTTRTKK